MAVEVGNELGEGLAAFAVVDIALCMDVPIYDGLKIRGTRGI